MKKVLMGFLFAVLTLICSSAFAQVDTKGLTPSQQAELTIQAEKMKQEAVSSVEGSTLVPKQVKATVDVASRWAEAGKSLAVGLGAGAREIGVAVNEFSESRVGRITTYIIVWKLMGKEILSLVVSFGMVFIGLPTLWYLYKRVTVKKIEYEFVQGWFGRQVRKVKIYTRITMDSGDEGAFLILSTIAWAIMSITLFCNAIHILPF